MEKKSIIYLGSAGILAELLPFIVGEGYDITQVDIISDAIDTFKKQNAFCLILDASIFDQINYLDLYYNLNQHIKPTQVIFIVEPDSDIWMKKLYSLGYSLFIKKPIHLIEILGAIRCIGTINKLNMTMNCNKDNLTKLPNKTQFLLDIHEAINKARQSNTIMAVVSIYFDHFKMINDQTGNHGGDAILKEIATALKSVIPTTNILSRTGGVEFGVLIQGATNKHEVTAIAQNIEHTLLNPFYYNTHEFQLRFLIGISLFPEDGDNAETLYSNAESARMFPKPEDTHRYRFYNNDIYIDSFKQLKMQNSLLEAIDRSEFLLHYQPHINLATQLVDSAEAFIRWQHPEKELLASREFIKMAEQTGLIIPIGEWVMYEACHQAKAWIDAGYKNSVSINLSDHQFNKKNCIELVEKALTFTKLPAKFLEIELTESMILSDINNAIALCKELKNIGIKLSIDDFGTGFSSINYLKKLSIDKIKIDKSFIHNIGMATEGDIVKAMISMAHDLDLKVVAEGVESQAQLDFLMKYMCDGVQGFLFCPPVPPKEFVYFLETGKPQNRVY